MEVPGIYSDFQSESKSSTPALPLGLVAVTDFPCALLLSSTLRYSNWLKLPVLAIAAAALAMALIDFMRKDSTPQQTSSTQKEEFEDGI